MNTIFNPGPCFPDGSVVKNPLANAGNVRDTGLIPGSGRSLGEGNGKPLHYSCLDNSMDRGAWWAAVDGSLSLSFPDAAPGCGATMAHSQRVKGMG